MPPPWYPFGRNSKVGSGSGSGFGSGSGSGSGSPSMVGASRAPRSGSAPDPDQREQDQEANDTVEPDPVPPIVRGRTQSNKIPVKKAKIYPLVKQYYRRYELEWEDLRGWLMRKFPESDFPGIEFTYDFDSKKDEFVFWVPRELTKAEFDDIKKLRKDYRP